MIKVGSYFISKQEVLTDSTIEKPYPQKDRLEIVHDLVMSEASF
jgi:hypothetical protein